MPDPLNSGVDFASRLVSNVYGLHKQDKDQERADAENARQATIRILEGAANSGNVNPEDMPHIYEQLLGLIGAKSKDIATFIPHVQAAFSQNTVNRPRPKRWNTTAIDEIPVTNTEPIPQSPVIPEVPTTISGPAIRMMSPEEKASRATAAEVARQQALLPGELQKQQSIYGYKTELQKQAIQARTEGHIKEIQKRGDVKDLATYAQRYQANIQGGMDSDTARAEAAEYARNLMDANVAVKQGQANVSAARVKNYTARIEDARQRTTILANRAATYATSVEQSGRLAASSEQGRNARAAATNNLKSAEIDNKALYTDLQALNKEIGKLETSVASDGNLVSADSEEVQSQISSLKRQRDGIQSQISATNRTWKIKGPSDNSSVIPPVPQMRTILRKNLGAARSQNPNLMAEHPEFQTDDNAFIQYLNSRGYAVKDK